MSRATHSIPNRSRNDESMAKHALFIVLLLAVSGCATASKLNRLSLGMSKGQVIEELGDPDTTMAKDEVEVLVYHKYATGDDAFVGRSTQYAVFIQNGKVTKYGRASALGGPDTKKLIIQTQSGGDE